VVIGKRALAHHHSNGRPGEENRMAFWTKLRALFQPAAPEEKLPSQRLREIEAELLRLPIVTDGREKRDGGLASNENRQPVSLSEAARRIESTEGIYHKRAEPSRDSGLQFNVGSSRETHFFTWYRIDETRFVVNEYYSGD
jgi:hypothetical protein